MFPSLLPTYFYICKLCFRAYDQNYRSNRSYQMVIPESHILKKKTAVVSVIPNRYYFKNVFVVAVIPKLYFQHRITFKHPIVVAVLPNRFSSRVMFFVGFIPKWFFHVRFPFSTEQKINNRCRSNTNTVLLSNP